MRFGFDNSYARLPERFFARVMPARLPAPKLVKLNEELARELGLDVAALRSAAGVEVLAGNRVAEGSEPLAMAYAGHQFGGFVPQLGDGRANLLGEVIGLDGKRYDVQLKGSGRTPFSRGGDGKAALGPVLREYIVSEAMAALGVPTTRALAAVTTGETVMRDRMLPGAVFTRVAASHLRVGTFQYFWARGDVDGLRVLAEYAARRHYPETVGVEKPYRALLDGVIGRHARLVAQWMGLGFVHGVMNTDNTSISGETIDYGPCAFMEEYDPATVFSSIDHRGRYAYANQAAAAHWNLTRLAEAMLPLLVAEEGGDEAGLASAHEALGAFVGEYERAWGAVMEAKLGVAGEPESIEEVLRLMKVCAVDWTNFFRGLCDGEEEVRGMFAADAAGFSAWAGEWRGRCTAEGRAGMRGVNPAVIPRNHRVEAVIVAAVDRGDFGPFEEMLEVVARPFEDRGEFTGYRAGAEDGERVTATFCGT